MSKYEKYTLMVGEKGAERLRILNQVCNPFTLPVLDNLSLNGKHILDLGCGTGIMTAELLKRVGRQGSVTAADFSKEQLAMAKQNVARLDQTNVEFVELDARKIASLEKKFDLIYCRFVLAHLDNPELVLEGISASLKTGGYFFSEEPTSFDAMFSDPGATAFDQFKKYTINQTQIYKTDFFIGKKIHSLSSQYGLHTKNLELIQPILRTEEEKRHSELLLIELSPALIAGGFARETEIQKTIKDLQDFSANKNSIAAFLQYMQLLSKKI